MDSQSIDQHHDINPDLLDLDAAHEQANYGALPPNSFSTETLGPWTDLERHLSPTQAVINSFPGLSIGMAECPPEHANSGEMNDNESTPRPQKATILNQVAPPEYQIYGTDMRVSLALSVPNSQPLHSHQENEVIQNSGGPTPANDASFQVGFYADDITLAENESMPIGNRLSTLAQVQSFALHYQTLLNGSLHESSSNCHDERSAETFLQDILRVVSQTSGASTLTHNQRILVSVKAPDGTDVPLFALIRFDISRSFIEERVVRQLDLEIHPVPLGMLKVEQTHLGFFTPDYFACFPFTLSTFEVVGVSTSMLVVNTMECLDPIILGRNFLEQALGYNFSDEPGEAHSAHQKMTSTRGTLNKPDEHATQH